MKKVVSTKASEVVNDKSDKFEFEKDDELSFLRNRFKRTLKKHDSYGNNKNLSLGRKKDYKEKIVCYDSKKQGHFLAECPDQEKKKNKFYKNFFLCQLGKICTHQVKNQNMKRFI